MNRAEKKYQSNSLSFGRVALTLAFAALLSNDVRVNACMSWQKCLSLAECRKAQKESNLPAHIIKDVESSFFYPCDDFPIRKICCTVRSPNAPVEEPEPEDPGYTIISGEETQPSQKAPVFLPLPNDIQESGKGTFRIEKCGTFRKEHNGENAGHGQFPWLTLIGSKDDTGKLHFSCGGSLINNHYILTSASCIQNMKSPPEIARLGQFNIKYLDESLSARASDENYNAVQDHDIEEIINHEDFNIPVFKNDISLLRLKETISYFTDCIRPICLPTESLKSEFFTTVGWGIDNRRNIKMSITPKFGNLTLLDKRECEYDLAIPLQPLSETQLCAKGNELSCYGDGGGPLIGYTTNGDTEQAVLVGIVSYTPVKCNSPFNRELFTNVTSFADWINKNIIK